MTFFESSSSSSSLFQHVLCRKTVPTFAGHVLAGRQAIQRGAEPTLGRDERVPTGFVVAQLFALAVLSSAARSPRASFSASSLAQKCMKNSRGCSISM